MAADTDTLANVRDRWLDQLGDLLGIGTLVGNKASVLLDDLGRIGRLVDVMGLHHGQRTNVAASPDCDTAISLRRRSAGHRPGMEWPGMIPYSAQHGGMEWLGDCHGAWQGTAARHDGTTRRIDARRSGQGVSIFPSGGRQPAREDLTTDADSITPLHPGEVGA